MWYHQSIVRSYSNLWKLILLAFLTFYLAEAGFNHVNTLLSESRSRLDIIKQSNLWLKMANLKPDVSVLAVTPGTESTLMIYKNGMCMPKYLILLLFTLLSTESCNAKIVNVFFFCLWVKKNCYYFINGFLWWLYFLLSRKVPVRKSFQLEFIEVGKVAIKREFVQHIVSRKMI